ncbi:MAG TPA: hydrogenase maturation nickel metallochaperone HypA [candidate division Zixibacteria bacterium]|nr:hydrogenase maturation nickel metallochaperone HypA [candidate division Zixibacteria bacterium]
MHELALAESIFHIVEKEMTKYPGSKALKVAIKLGALHEIVPDALQFGFDTMTANTSLAGVQLDIERIPIKGRCRNCGHEIVIEDFVFICPDCFSSDIEMTQGDALEITHLEIE